MSQSRSRRPTRVESATRLTAEPTRLTIFYKQGTGPITRPQPLRKHLGDCQDSIEADQVRELERAHRVIEPQLDRRINVLDGAETLHQRLACFVEERDQQPI